MAEELLENLADNLSAVVIIPSSGGRFVVKAGETVVYNKAETHRFPEQGEVTRLLSRLT